jgi:Anti-sigma-K factor rskA/Putative zinc-finger
MATEHDELANGIPALVLGSVTADERQQLLLHLEGCASCRALASRLARGAAVLPMEPDPIGPPARLHGRVLAAVAAARQDPAPRRSPRQRPPLPRPRRRHARLGGLRLGLAAVVTVAFLVGTGVGMGLGHVPLPFQSPGAGQGGGQVAARYPLHGTGDMAGVTADAVVLRRDGVAVVDFRNLPQPAAGQVYELWLLTGDGSALPAGVFVPDAAGSGVVLVTRDLRGTRELAVTVERGPDGATAPTQTPRLSGRIEEQ